MVKAIADAQSQRDAAQLAAFGHSQELTRSFSFISMLGLAFAILNSWTALATSLSLALPSGGPVAVMWGLLAAGVGSLALAASNAEFLSSYPTSAGQYHWAAIISPPKYTAIVSWVTGWINVGGWVALSASGGVLGASLLCGLINLYNTDFSPQPWQQFLVYLLYTFLGLLTNMFMGSALPIVTKAALFWSIIGFVTISIVILARASPEFQSASFVFGEFSNSTGWPDGVAFLLGLLQGALGLVGSDAVAHMIEEIPRPTVHGPRIMIACVVIGIVTGFIFLMCLLFVITDADAVVMSLKGPLVEIFYQATRNQAATACITVFPIVCLVFATIGIMATSTRMVYAFARDGGLPFSRVFAKVHPRLDIPLNALILTNVVVVIFGLIYLGSTSAFNAILSASVIALSVSYAIAPAINCLRGRKMLLSGRSFILPSWLGWACNLFGIAYVVVITIFFVFPPALPVTGANMNYAIVAFAVIILISTVQWFVDGRHNYKGPSFDEEAYLQASAGSAGIDAEGSLIHGQVFGQRSPSSADPEALANGRDPAKSDLQDQ